MVVPISNEEAPLVEVPEAVEEDPAEPAVPEAVFVDGLPAVDEAEPEAVRVAMLMVWLRGRAVPVPALAVPTAVPMVPGAIGTVVEAVPLAETVLLMYMLGLAVADDEEAELTAEATAPWTWKGPK